MSNIINKAKDAMSGNSHGTTSTNTSNNYGTHGGSGLTTDTANTYTSNDGPHRSNFANKLDPRVDSDRDGRNDPTSHVGGVGQTQGYNNASATTAGHNATGGYGTTGHTTYGGTGVAGGSALHSNVSTTHSTATSGPHSSNLANKLDPRVDSDNDNRNNPASQVGGLGHSQGYTPHSSTTTGHGAMGRGPEGYGSTGYTGGPAVGGVGHNTGSTQTSGPHSSNITNKLDPRVDSDNDGRNDPASRTGGLGQTQGYTTASTTTAGHHATGGHTAGAGHTAGHTAGNGTHAGIGSTGTHSSHTQNVHLNQPVHNSALLNKLDPRVKDEEAANAAAAAAKR